MRGQEAILNMRRAGKKPSIVFVNDYPCDTDWHEYAEHATVQILPSETIDLLDFRFVVGMQVSVSGSTMERAKAIARACKAAGAKTVGAGCGDWAYIWHQPEMAGAY